MGENPPEAPRSLGADAFSVEASELHASMRLPQPDGGYPACRMLTES